MRIGPSINCNNASTASAGCTPKKGIWGSPRGHLSTHTRTRTLTRMTYVKPRLNSELTYPSSKQPSLRCAVWEGFNERTGRALAAPWRCHGDLSPRLSRKLTQLSNAHLWGVNVCVLSEGGDCVLKWVYFSIRFLDFCAPWLTVLKLSIVVFPMVRHYLVVDMEVAVLTKHKTAFQRGWQCSVVDFPNGCNACSFRQIKPLLDQTTITENTHQLVN